MSIEKPQSVRKLEEFRELLDNLLGEIPRGVRHQSGFRREYNKLLAWMVKDAQKTGRRHRPVKAANWDRDALMLADYRQSRSLTRLAKEHGLTVSGVRSALRRAEKR
jgi:hypothetical protein